MATAPVEPLIKYVGYEDVVGTDQVVLKPNFINEPAPQPTENRTAFQDIPYLTEEEAKQALAHFVDSKCCYSSKPVKSLTFTNLESSNTFRYVLETFTESRATSWVSEPYMGQPLGNTGMAPPGPWDIPCQPSAMFNDQEIKIEVPGTAYVKRCDPCVGVGYTTCCHCRGCGRSTCTACNGSGRIFHANPGYNTFDEHHAHEHQGHVDIGGHHVAGGESHGHHHQHGHPGGHTDVCTSCSGTGYSSCHHCNGSGREICGSCQGRGNMKWYIQLIIRFKNNLDDYIKKSESIPDDLVRTCSAKTIFSEQNSRLYPITHHQDQDINMASNNLVQTHLSKFSNGRILYQRQSVLAIPVTLCSYTYKEKPYKYYVYGLDQQVYSPDYPAKCCCTIL